LKSEPIMVTGGGGFLGSHLVDLMMKEGYEKILVPRSAEYDLTNQNVVNMMMDCLQPHTVIHLAASVGGIGANQDNPGTFFYDNMAMGINMIHASAVVCVEKFVMVGTTCSYPKYAPLPFKERDLWDGYPEKTNAPYGIAKRALLSMLAAYENQYNMSFTYLIPTNLFGPGDNFEPETSHVIPAMIRKCLSAVYQGHNKITLWGNGSATRDFLYVKDAARGILTATKNFYNKHAFNLGSGKEISMKDLSVLIAEITGYKGTFFWDYTKPNGQPRRFLDTTRTDFMLSWCPEWSLNRGILETVEYFQAHLMDKLKGEVGIE